MDIAGVARVAQRCEAHAGKGLKGRGKHISGGEDARDHHLGEAAALSCRSLGPRSRASDRSGRAFLASVRYHIAKTRMSVDSRKGKVSVTLVSGLDQTGKTKVVNDLVQLLKDVRVAILTHHVCGASRCAHSDTPGACIIHYLGDFTAEFRELAAREEFDHVIIEIDGLAEPQLASQAFDSGEEEGGLKDIACLHLFATVIDCSTFWDDVYSVETVADRLPASEERRNDLEMQPIATVLFEQIEIASVVVLRNPEAVEENALLKIKSVVERLNPCGSLVDESCSSALADVVRSRSIRVAADGAGWLQELKASGVAQKDSFITSFVYRARKPFHPQRLYDWIDQRFILHLEDLPRDEEEDSRLPSQATDALSEHELGRAVKRLKRADTEEASHASTGLWYAELPASQWPEDAEVTARIKADFDKGEPEIGDRRQELVFFGSNLRREELRNALDSCLVTQEELARLPTLPDPFFASED
eukprot:scaffold1741_cov409-Prasinococcus_capsulatus_cf.AAC.1